MSDDPDIVKELREEEKLGNLQSLAESSLEYDQEEGEEEEEETNFFTGGYQRTEEEIDLKDIEAKYRTIFENYAVAITLADEKERIVSWNKYAEELLNMDEKDLFLRNVSTLYPPDKWKEIRDKNIRQKGMKYKIETKMIRKNKEPIDVEISLCVLKGIHDKVVGSIGIIKDITILKDYEKRLIETEEKYKTIFENSAVGIMLLDKNENIVSWNTYTKKLLGYSDEDLNLKKVESLYPSEEWKKIRAENIREKGMQHHLETKIWTKKDKLIDVDISISVLKNHEGKIIGSIGIIRDVTDIKKSEERYERLFRSSPDGIIEVSEDGTVLSLNPAMSKNLGVKPENLIGKKLDRIIPKEVLEERTKIALNAIKENKIQVSEDNNKGRYFHNIYVPIISSDGTKSIQCIVRDTTDQHKTEQALTDGEKKYRGLFESAIDPIIVLDKNGTFIDLNIQATNLLKYNREELIGKKFYEAKILDENSLKETMQNFKKRIKGEKIPPYEIKAITKEGEFIPAEINANAIYDNGEIIGELVILRDIRERYAREKIQKELNESEEKFGDIFDATSDFLVYLEKGIILDINNAAINICNVSKHDIVGKNFSIFKEFFSEEDIKKHYDAIEITRTGGDVHDYETELETPKGTKYELLFSADCIRDHEEIKGILIRGKDITQRHRAWQELVKLEEKYRVLAETSADGVITIDPLGRLTYVNPSFEKMLNRRKSQILATMFRNYLSEDSVYFFQQISIDSRKKDTKIENVELELVNSNGDIVPIEVNIAPFKKEDEFAGLVCTIRDITERRKVEDELKKSERLKTEFMNIAAHELKSPVTPIKGYLDLIISDEGADDKIKDWAKVSLRNSERLLRLVNDILDVSRLDTDTMSFEMIKLPIVEILDEIAEDMKPSIEGKDIKFITDIPRDLPKIMGDKHRLSQVLKNLLVNALKFTDNGSISILAEKQKENILIKIADTGIGISKDEVKKIFNKFYQAYTGDDRKNEGTGLGLFICREILQKHNGDIWVESKLGKGSTFYIKIPYLHQMVVNLKK